MEEEHAVFVRLSRHARARVAKFNRPMASRKSGTPRLGVLHAEIDFRNAHLGERTKPFDDRGGAIAVRRCDGRRDGIRKHV